MTPIVVFVIRCRMCHTHWAFKPGPMANSAQGTQNSDKNLFHTQRTELT